MRCISKRTAVLLLSCGFVISVSCGKAAPVKPKTLSDLSREDTSSPSATTSETLPGSAALPAPTPQQKPTTEPAAQPAAQPAEQPNPTATPSPLPRSVVEPRLPQDVRGMDALVLFRPSVRLYPEDFALGRLEPYFGGDVKIRPFIDTARAFLEKLAAGKPSVDLVVPEMRAIIATQLDVRNLPSITGFRIAEATTRKDGTTSINVRLYADQGRAEGELILEKRGTDTLVTAFLLELSDLSTPSPPRSERYEPTSYKAFFP